VFKREVSRLREERKEEERNYRELKGEEEKKRGKGEGKVK